MACFLDKIYRLIVARGNVMFSKYEFISISLRTKFQALYVIYWAQNVRG